MNDERLKGTDPPSLRFLSNKINQNSQLHGDDQAPDSDGGRDLLPFSFRRLNLRVQIAANGGSETSSKFVEKAHRGTGPAPASNSVLRSLPLDDPKKY